jgi:hypothetical protein
MPTPLFTGLPPTMQNLPIVRHGKVLPEAFLSPELWYSAVHET